MKLPTFLPENLSLCETASDDNALFQMLLPQPVRLIEFLEKACDDETWAEAHAEFMETSFKWLTEQFYLDRIAMEYLKNLSTTIRDHYPAISPFLPLNITIELQDRHLPVNGLIYGSRSEPLRSLFLRECRDKDRKNLPITSWSYNTFDDVHTYIITGSTGNLFRKSQEQILEILSLAITWGLPDLVNECQRELAKYISIENVSETLMKSYSKHYEILSNACMDFINRLDLGFALSNRGWGTFAFEFLNYSENALTWFNKLRSLLTHLIFGPAVADAPEFVEVLSKTPKLRCIDISRTTLFSTYFREIPLELKELEASACSWMTDENLKNLSEICPSLLRLKLMSNIKITFEGWGVLKNFIKLQTLDITRCSQVGDEDLRIILQSVPTLISLNLEECRGISEGGFLEIADCNKGLSSLNISRTNITDESLIQIAVESPYLTSLSVARCDHVTEVGIFEVVENSLRLIELDATRCPIAPAIVEKIHHLRPQLSLKL